MTEQDIRAVQALADWVAEAAEYRYDDHGPSFEVRYDCYKFYVTLSDGAYVDFEGSDFSIEYAALNAARGFMAELRVNSHNPRGFKTTVRSLVHVLRKPKL